MTGEHDWLNSPAQSKATADKIQGAMLKSLPNLGQFPMTEDPKIFIPHLFEAIEHIQNAKKV